MIYPGGTTVAYAYDALNRMDTVTEGGVVQAKHDGHAFSKRPGEVELDDFRIAMVTSWVSPPFTRMSPGMHSLQVADRDLRVTCSGTEIGMAQNCL